MLSDAILQAIQHGGYSAIDSLGGMSEVDGGDTREMLQAKYDSSMEKYAMAKKILDVFSHGAGPDVLEFYKRQTLHRVQFDPEFKNAADCGFFRGGEANLVLHIMGAMDEARPKDEGLCHALEHMLYAGTKNRDWMEMNRALERLGSWFNSYTWHDRTIYQVTCLKRNWKEAYEVLADMMYNPTFPEERWEEVDHRRQPRDGAEARDDPHHETQGRKQPYEQGKGNNRPNHVTGLCPQETGRDLPGAALAVQTDVTKHHRRDENLHNHQQQKVAEVRRRKN
ncbi:MAG: insulinase family protein [Candidatus Hydrogenedentes bacterium]|nr:insulinase family protein [Candidatus Hydrogenedentota bacterium]